MGACLSVDEGPPRPPPFQQQPYIYAAGPVTYASGPGFVPAAAVSAYHAPPPPPPHPQPPNPSMSAGLAGGASWPPPDPALPGAPRYFVGSAWHQTCWDLATKHQEWPAMRQAAGFHLHPMGFHGQARAKGYAEQLLAAFARHQWFTLEADLHDTCACSLRDNPVTFGEDLQLVGPAWRCAAFMPWVNAERMVRSPEEQRDLYCEVFAKARAKEVHQNYIFWAPPSPEGQRNYDELMTATRDGLPLWIWLAREAGAVGVAIDHPAQQWQNNPELRPLGLKVGHDCALYGLKFIWVVNGTATRAQTAALAEDVRRTGLPVHHWIVDQFADEQYPGTPEWGESAVGQLQVLVGGGY